MNSNFFQKMDKLPTKKFSSQTTEDYLLLLQNWKFRKMNEATNTEATGGHPEEDSRVHSLQEDLQLAAKKLTNAVDQNVLLQQQIQEHEEAAKSLSSKSKALESEIHRWQHDYQQLRIQKGGFGFKALAAVSSATLLVGVAIGWLLFKQKQPDSVVFDKFNHAAGFSLEYHVAHKEYPAAERLISKFRHDPYYSTILPQLDLLLHLVQAAKMASDSTHIPQ